MGPGATLITNRAPACAPPPLSTHTRATAWALGWVGSYDDFFMSIYSLTPSRSTATTSTTATTVSSGLPKCHSRLAPGHILAERGAPASAPWPFSSGVGLPCGPRGHSHHESGSRLRPAAPFHAHSGHRALGWVGSYDDFFMSIYSLTCRCSTATTATTGAPAPLGSQNATPA